MKTLKNLLLDQLAEMYETEQEVAKALSRMSKLASNNELKEALQVHADETMGHILKVAQVYECFGEQTAGMKGHTTSKLLAEAYALVAEHQQSPASDAAIIEAVQKLEHFEIATYGGLRDWAKTLNNNEAAILLEEILDEEKSGDLKLSELAHIVNVDALGEAEWHRDTQNEGEETLATQERGRNRKPHGPSRREP